MVDTNVLDKKGKPKIITYDNIEKHIDKYYADKKFGMSSKEVLNEYDKKRLIQQNPELRHKLNKKMYPAYNDSSFYSRRFFSPFHIHHTAGRDKNVFNVQLTTGSDNMKEGWSRRRFNSDFKLAKTLSDKKEALKRYVDAVPENVEVRLKNVPYGQREVFIDQLKRVGEGIKIPDSVQAQATKLKANMVPGLETLINTVKSIPDDFKARRYWTVGLKGLGIAATPLIAYDGYTAIKEGLPADEVVAKALFGADKLLYKGKEVLQLTPEEREARSVVKQERLKELNEDQMMGFGYIEGPEVESDLSVEEAEAKWKEGQDRYADFREERDAARAKQRKDIFTAITDPQEILSREISAASGGRVGFDEGSKPKSPGRRAFLKGITALAALPIVGKYFKLGKVLERSKTYLGPTVEKVKGMPEWFPGLVKKLFNEGEDVTKQVATKERMVVKRGTLEGGDDVDMIYDLDTGNVSIEVVPKKGEFSTKSGAYEKPYGLDYKKGQADEMTGGTPVDEFGAVEARPFQVGRDDVDLDYDMIDIDDAMSDLQELENFAKKKK